MTGGRPEQGPRTGKGGVGAEAALDDLFVLDFSRILAGPYCTMMLADLGAEVVKVERPGSGDGTRSWGPPWVGDESAYFLSVNRNKKSLTLDLSTPRGREIGRALAIQADVVVENFRPGTMERFGLDYPSLAAEHPGLVYCSITGYGQTGPRRDLPGYDFTIQAEGGLMSITGPVEGEPCKVGVAVGDIVAGLHAATSVLAALRHRSRTGEGQHIDVALLDSQVAWLVNVAQNYLATGEIPGRYGNAHPNIVPYETFPASDGHVAVGMGSDEQFRRFCEVAGRPELWEDERFRTNAGRVEHRDELIPRLRDVFRHRTVETWVELLREARIPVGPVNDVGAALEDPQVRARGMVREVEHEREGPVRILGPVPRLSATPASVRSAPPPLGRQTREVLAARLGYDAAEIEGLRDAGVV